MRPAPTHRSHHRVWRLQVGELQLVRARDRVRGEQRWVLPGGAVASFAEVVQWARRMGLPKPVVLYGVSDRFPEKRKGMA